MLLVFGAKQSEQDGQRDRPAVQARQLDDKHDDHPAVPPARPPTGPFRLGAVVEVVSTPHVPAGAAEQSVIDREADRRAGLHEHAHEEVQQRDAELIRLPSRPREEVVRPAMVPVLRQPGSLQHPRDRAITNPADHPDQQHTEGLETRPGETSRQQGQQTSERTGNLKHGGDPPVSRPRSGAANARGRWTYRPPDSGSPLLSPAQRLKPPSRARQRTSPGLTTPGDHPKSRKSRGRDWRCYLWVQWLTRRRKTKGTTACHQSRLSCSGVWGEETVDPL